MSRRLGAGVDHELSSDRKELNGFYPKCEGRKIQECMNEEAFKCGRKLLIIEFLSGLHYFKNTHVDDYHLKSCFLKLLSTSLLSLGS